MTARDRYKMVYQWNLAFRIDHWVRVIAMFTLIFTGYYIYWPFIAGSDDGQLMNWMRFLHFVSAYIIVLGLIAHVYFEKDIDDLLPTWGNLKNVPDILFYYLFIKDSHKEYERYNPLQGITYGFWGTLLIIQTFTGFAIYSGDFFGMVSSQAVFGWVNTLLGGERITRLVHFVIMWIFIITIPVHIYMVILEDLTERNHTIKSMFTGYKLKKVK